MNLTNEQKTGSLIYNVADDQPITQRDCYEWLAAKLGQPVPPTVPFPGTRKRGTSNKRVSNRKLRALGWAPQFSTFAAGMENSVLPAAAEAAEF